MEEFDIEHRRTFEPIKIVDNECKIIRLEGEDEERVFIGIKDFDQYLN